MPLSQLIDFGKYLHGSPEERQSIGKAILAGFQKAGFLYLKNHDIDFNTISRVFSFSARFFARPQSEKDSLAWTTPRSNRGYVTQGREKVTNLEDKADVEALRATAPDLKESMEIGRDDEPGYPNRWPDRIDEEGRRFKEVMHDFFQICKELHIQVMRAVALGLEIDENWFDEYTDGGDNTLRLLHYPAVEKSVFEKNDMQTRAGEHTDYGMDPSAYFRAS